MTFLRFFHRRLSWKVSGKNLYSIDCFSSSELFSRLKYSFLISSFLLRNLFFHSIQKKLDHSAADSRVYVDCHPTRTGWDCMPLSRDEDDSTSHTSRDCQLIYGKFAKQFSTNERKWKFHVRKKNYWVLNFSDIPHSRHRENSGK